MMNNYEKDILTDQEFNDNNVEVSPNYYIFDTIKKIQESLISENLNDGMIKYCFLVQHLESLCEASNILDNEYSEFKKEFQKKDKSSSTSDNFKFSEKKLKKLLGYIFESKEIRGTLKA